MSLQVPVAFEKKYAADFLELAQQKGSRFYNAVRLDAKQGAAALYFDRVGATAMVKKTSRHGDTPIVDTPFSRRKVVTDTYQWADLIDRDDVQKMMKSLDTVTMQSGMHAAGRSMDDIIIAAMRGNATAVDADDASTSIALPSAQKVAAASAGLTLAKVIATKKIFDAAEIPDNERFFSYAATQMADLLAIAQVTSADYQTVKALTNGQVPAGFMGFNWIPSQRLIKASTTRYCLAWAKQSVGIYVPGTIFTKFSDRADKAHAQQAFVEFSMGAVRIEDAGVVEIACIES